MTTPTRQSTVHLRRSGSRAHGDVLAAAAGTLLVLACAVWGHWLEGRGIRLHLSGAQPITGRGGTVPVNPALVATCLLLGVGLQRWLPGAADAWPWRRLLVASGAITAAWAVALALTAGPGALAEPLTTRWEYLADVGRVGDIGSFLATFTSTVPLRPAGCASGENASTTRTPMPASTSAHTTCDPTNPAPPVTRTLMVGDPTEIRCRRDAR